jgi:hypothetical protein
MRTFSIAAVIAFGGVLATVSAQAEQLGGGSKYRGNQCFTFSQGQEKDGRFGTWGACPQTASAPIPANANASAAAGHARRHATTTQASR